MIRRLAILSLPLLVAAVFLSAAALADEKPKGDDAASIRIAILTFGNGKASRCFAPGFLTEVVRQTSIPVARQFSTVALDSAELFQHPFVILTGEGKFTLGDQEAANLRAYLQNGGFLLASSGCSSPEFTTSFRAAMKALLPDTPEKPIAPDHAVFHSLYDIGSLGSRQNDGGRVEIFGMDVEGRLAVVFSPYGLNESESAGGDCCCCGGNEIRQAKLVNANILTYALTH